MIDHLKFFGEFVHYEKLNGGPDPHMKAMVELCKGLPFEQQIWRVALYVGVYNVPTAEAIWGTFPGYPYSAEHHLLEFFQANWEGMRFRRERKSVALDSTHGENLTVYCRGAYRTMQELPELQHDPDFEKVWRFANSLPHIGRYGASKLCETWYQLGLVKAECPDIRPKGGWSPRTALTMIYPESGHDPYDNSHGALDHANGLSMVLKRNFPQLSMFELEVLLCEYKTSYSTKRQFPGRSLDSELSYERAIYEHWHPNGGVTEHMRVRRFLSPEWALGEIQGWDPNERLKNLGRVLSKNGYTWSDSLYDYNATTDFANPVRKAGPGDWHTMIVEKA